MWSLRSRLPGGPMKKPRVMSRRRFLVTAGALGASRAALPSVVSAGAEPATKETLRPVVDAADLAITDTPPAAPARGRSWARGEAGKLRDVDTGITGPANGYIPPVNSQKRS